jgi:DNA-binding transcriptional LysR family regulator
VRRVVCASPAFLKAHGTPRAPADLAALKTIAFALGESPEPWSFAAGEAVRPASQLLVNSLDVALDAARAGHGVARALSYQVEPHLRSGELKIVLAAHEPPPVPVSLVYLEGRRAPARVRSFVDFAVERLRRQLRA